MSFRLCIGVGVLSLLACVQAAQGDLLVSDRATNRVLRYNESTGTYLGELVSGDPAVNGGLFGPSALAVAGSDLFVASQLTGQVLKYNVDSGAFLGVFANQLNGPSGLLFDDIHGVLNISTLGNFDSELVMQYQVANGEFVRSFGQGTGPTGRTSMTFGPDGKIYVSAFAVDPFFSGAVLQFDAETLASQGSFASLQGLAGANDLTFTSRTEGAYDLDVVGLFSNTVARFEIGTGADGKLVNQGGRILLGENLDFPSSILHTGEGKILVSNLGNDNPATGELRPGSIARFDANTGKFLDYFAVGGGPVGLAQPTDMLVYRSSSLDCNGDGAVTGADLDCGCGTGKIPQILTSLQRTSGDLDLNGEVAFADFLILSQSFGKGGGYRQGDLDCSGSVAFADFLILSANFGKPAAGQIVAGQLAAGAQTGGTLAVPEPGMTVSLVVFACWAIGLHRIRTSRDHGWVR